MTQSIQGSQTPVGTQYTLFEQLDQDQARASAAPAGNAPVDDVYSGPRSSAGQLEQLRDQIDTLAGSSASREVIEAKKKVIRSHIEGLAKELHRQKRDGVPGVDTRMRELNDLLVFANNRKIGQSRSMWFDKQVRLLDPDTVSENFFTELPIKHLRTSVALALRNHNLEPSGIKRNVGYITNGHQARAAMSFIANGYWTQGHDYLSGLKTISTSRQADVAVAMCEKRYQATGQTLFAHLGLIENDEQARIAIGLIRDGRSNPIKAAVELAAVTG